MTPEQIQNAEYIGVAIKAVQAFMRGEVDANGERDLGPLVEWLRGHDEALLEAHDDHNNKMSIRW